VDELTSLAKAAGAGDRRALERFVRMSQADVWRFCAHLVDRGAADDLTQETFARALRALPRFRGDASARTWLLTIARHTCADHVRSAQRRRRLHDHVAQHHPEVVAADGSGAVDALALLDGLGPEQRSAMVLTQVLGLSYDEAAEVAGVPIGTIRSRVSRARQHLLTQFGDEATGS
jgi:RNA polymerase sigma-70 factor (ECF subfamily)